MSKLPNYKHRSSDLEINRLNPLDGMGVAPKAEVPVYTGTKMVGIAVQHKSCLQPIFSQEEAVESATMRRG